MKLLEKWKEKWKRIGMKERNAFDEIEKPLTWNWKKKSSKEEEKEFLDGMAKEIEPSAKTILEMEKYLQENYHGTLINLSIMQRRALLSNVLEQYFPEIPKQDFTVGFDQKEQNDPSEELGLEFICYRIPAEELPDTEKDDVVSLERKTGYFSVRHSEHLQQALLLYRGVSEEDILNRTPRFVPYAYAKAQKEDEKFD